MTPKEGPPTLRECPPELTEKLADLEHERWSGWIKHQFKKGRFDNDGKTWTMPQWAVARWMKLSVTPYAELDEEAKEMDRVEVRKTWAVVAKALEREEKRRAALEKNNKVMWEALVRLSMIGDGWGAGAHAKRMASEALDALTHKDET